MPASGRSPGQYRLYSEADLHRLEFVRHAKALGLTLDEIRELVASARKNGRGMTRVRLRRALTERIAQTTGQIATLARLRKELERRRRELTRRAPSGQGYCTCLHERPRGQ